jgi:photosystem II stability/assembly factor-like uncharacterized protein
MLLPACIPQLIPSISSTTVPQDTENASATPVQVGLPTGSPTQTATYKATESVSWRALGEANPYINTIAINPFESTILYAGSRNTIYRSESGGENWKVSYTFDAKDEDTINKILVDPDNPNTIYAGIYNQGVLKSTDNGVSWSPINNGLVDKKILTLVINPTNANILYAGTESGLYQSNNQGNIWEFVSDTFKDERVNCIAIDPFSPTTLFAGTTSQGLFKSMDGGKTWQSSNLGLYIQTASMKKEAPTWVQDIVINPIDPETIYLAGYGAYKSNDGGMTWIAINEGLNSDSNGLLINLNFIQINPHAPETLFTISSRDNLFRSDDGGTHWYPYNTGIPSSTGGGPISPIAFDLYQANTMYIGTWNSGAFTTRQTRIFYPTETPTLYDCSHGWTQLKAGMYAYVVGTVNDAPNRVRKQPDMNSEQVGQVFPGMVLKVLEGPECSNGLVYWKVENNTIESGSGWTAEGDLENYWLEPYK